MRATSLAKGKGVLERHGIVVEKHFQDEPLDYDSDHCLIEIKVD